MSPSDIRIRPRVCEVKPADADTAVIFLMAWYLCMDAEQKK